MYATDDKSAAISEIQKYLHYIKDGKYQDMPGVGIDGIYGDETRDAVRAFQKNSELPESGEVDYETFMRLYEDYTDILELRDADELLIDYTLFPFKRGDRGRSVLYINILIDELGEIYTHLPHVRINDYYSSSTDAAVKEIRRLYLMELEEELFDISLYNRIVYELRHSR